NGEVSIRRELDGIAGKQCTVMVCQNASRNLAGAAILVADLIAVQPFRDSAHLQPQAGKQRRLILKADLFIYVFCPSGSLGTSPYCLCHNSSSVSLYCRAASCSRGM